MKKITALTLFWLHNSALLFLAFVVFPGNFVLGTYRHTVLVATLLSGLIWTLTVWFVRPIQRRFKIKIEGRLVMYPYYLVLNFATLWVTAHLAPYTGFGVTRFTWLIGLAIVANFVQATIWRIGAFSEK